MSISYRIRTEIPQESDLQVDSERHGGNLPKLCNEMKVEIIEAEACVDHIHTLVSIPPYMGVAQFVGTRKSKSALMIFDQHANLKYRYGSRNFGARGYFVDTLVKNEKVIANYIKNQLEEDFTKDRITLKELQTRLRVKEISKAKTNSHSKMAVCNRDAMVAFDNS